MRETDLDQMFAEFEASAAPTFRPPGVPEARRRTRARRRRRGLLTGFVALLLAGPAGAYAIAGRDGDETPPTPRPPDGQPVEWRVHPTGVAGQLTELRFVDARHGWALFDTCHQVDDLGRDDCRRDVARTVDGGETWQRVALPETGNRQQFSGPAHLLPVDGTTVTVVVGGDYLVTTDGGASFTAYPFGAPPPATRRGVATRSGFLLSCPGGDGLSDLSCAQLRLVRVDAAPVPTPPPVALPWGSDRQLIESGDGRLWLAVRQNDRLTVVVSADGATSWRRLPVVSDAARLLVSPDGRDAWLVDMTEDNYDGSTAKRVWQLIDEQWQERVALPPDTNSVAAVNGGLLAVTNPWGNVGYWTGDRYIDAPEPRDRFGNSEDDPTVEVLPDDTIVVTTGTTTTLGTGTAQTRTWTRLTH